MAKTKPKDDKLTPKQEAFIREYLICKNGVQAAKNAGYTGNYSTLGVTAHELLKNPKISAEIEKEEARVSEKLAKKYEITEEGIIQDLIRIARADPMSILEMDKKGRLVYRKNLDLRGFSFNIYPEYQTKEDKKEGIIRAKLSFSSSAADQRAALEMLGKTIGMWKDGKSGSDSDSRKAVLERLQAYLSRTRRSGSGGGS